MNEFRNIEILKGFTIFIILLSNAIKYWFASENALLITYLIAFPIMIFESFGALLFIFLNSFTNSFILEKKMGCIPEKSNRNKVIKQGLFLIMLGIPFNIILNPSLVYPFNLWGWNILTFLGFSQIICYFAYKIVRWTRIIIGIALIFLTFGIRETLLFWRNLHPIADIINFIIVSPYPNYPLLPYASISFFSTVFGELMYEAKRLDSKIAEINAISSILKYGIVLLVIGLIIPIAEFQPIITLDNYDPNKYPFIDMLAIFKSSFLAYIPNLPGFLLKGTPANLFFSMGIALLCIGLIFYSNYYKQNTTRVSNFFTLFGKFSITLLFIQYIFLYSFYHIIPLLFLFPLMIIYILLVGTIINFWEKYMNKFPSIDKIFPKLTS
jgi:hypothetical protein